MPLKVTSIALHLRVDEVPRATIEVWATNIDLDTIADAKVIGRSLDGRRWMLIEEEMEADSAVHDHQAEREVQAREQQHG